MSMWVVVTEDEDGFDGFEEEGAGGGGFEGCEEACGAGGDVGVGVRVGSGEDAEGLDSVLVVYSRICNVTVAIAMPLRRNQPTP